MNKIPASIGLLTYNSEEHLVRALTSIADFSDIIIADGGSTDRTLEIAKEYGARVISQSNPGHPITDFAKERNLLLAAAKEEWFFYLDSDEIMSPELRTFIASVSTSPVPEQAYRVRYQKTNPDGTKPYRTYREYYQIRLVRTGIGAHFVRPVHERLSLPPDARVGQTEASWFVPFEREEISPRAMIPKLWERTGMEAALWQPRGVGNILAHVIGIPFSRALKSLYKMVVVKLRYGREGMPASYEIVRTIYSIFLSIQNFLRLLRG